MNLLDAEWIPVRHASGRQRWIAPHQVTEAIGTDPVMTLDAPRADFNGALTQFLIGLIQTAWLRSDRHWDREELLWEPPSPDALRALFAPLRGVFDFDGDGPRFMQDLTLGLEDSPAENGIGALLIESPGESALERNTDHFVKRGGVQALCPDCAAAALFTLMTNAPSGGAGHRTSLRGGGPLTTLVVYDPERQGHPPRALWRDMVCNVLEPVLLLRYCDQQKADLKYIFPWLAPQRELQAPDPKAETQPLDVHPAHMFWAMPRRIRLNLDAVASGVCDLCGRASVRLVSRYHAKNYGLNYKGPWQHPLSPYYRSKSTEQALPMHPQPGGLGYRHWLGWVLGTDSAGKRVQPASVVQAFVGDGGGSMFRLWAFGYDLENMKVRCWYEATFPLFELPADGDATEVLRGIVNALLQPTEKVADYLRRAVCGAWLGNGEARGDLEFIEASYWSATEHGFFDAVREAVELAHTRGREAVEASVGLRERWVKDLRRAAFALFDLHAGSGDVASSHPERIAAAHLNLKRQLFGDALLRDAGLKPPEATATRRGRKAKAA